MSSVITVKKVNESLLQINSNDHGALMEAQEHFTFYADGYKFSPAYRNKTWDGKIKLLNLRNYTLPYGLLFELLKFAKTRNYQVELHSDITGRAVPSQHSLQQFVDTLQISDGKGNSISPRDYQVSAFIHAISNGRSLVISPTGCLDGGTIVDAEIKTGFSKHTFKELHDAYHAGKNIKLNTPDGPKRVIGAYIKHGPGFTVTFSDKTFFTGSVNHRVMRDGDFVKLCELKVGDILTNKDYNIIRIDAVPPQDWYDFSLDYEKECYYQNDVIHHNSGKSLLIYMMIRWYLQNHDKKILIVVPNVGLVEQLAKDFADYSENDSSFDASTCVHKIYSGKEKNQFDGRVVVTTWQSAITLPKAWFAQYGMVVGDESHLFRSKSLVSIMSNLTNAEYRIGTTGTLDGSVCNELVLVGNFGPVHKVITTKQLMQSDTLASLKIKCLVLNHDDVLKRVVSKMQYAQEIDAIVSHSGRNSFLTKLACDQKGNTLVLFNLVEKHGKPLFKAIEEHIAASKNPQRKVYYVSGEVSATQREAIRADVEKQQDAIIVASYNCFSTGINIKNLHSIIFAAPTKSQIRVLQSIGRGLRKADNGQGTVVYDVSDNFSWKKKKNYTMQHAVERIKIYDKEGFEYKIYEIPLPL